MEKKQLILLGVGGVLIALAGYYTYLYIKMYNAEQPLIEQIAIDDTLNALQNVDVSVLNDVTQADADELPRGNTEIAGGGDDAPDTTETAPTFGMPPSGAY